MRINNAGLQLIKDFEGIRLTAYKCSSNVPTIGYGHTSGVEMDTTITQTEADRLLQEDITYFENGVTEWARNAYVTLNENQFAACVSLAFNIGVGTFTRSTVARLLKEKDLSGASNAFLLWNKGDGNVIPGLQRRRASERDLFLQRVSSLPATLEIRFIASSFLKTRPADSSALGEGEKIAFPKDALLGVAAIALNKENGHHFITLGKVNGVQLSYLNRNTLWVFAKDVETI